MRTTGSEGGSSGESAAGAEEAGREVEWEMRPGGMLVQKRRADPGAAAAAVPEVRVRISYGSAKYEVSVSSLATFGEVKKLLTADTGLQPVEQRLMYRGKERRDGEYLDLCGVKNLSKVMLVQDPTSLERRYVEMRRNARIQSAQRAISDVSLEVDKLADQDVLVNSYTKGSLNGLFEVEELQRAGPCLSNNQDDNIPAGEEGCLKIRDLDSLHEKTKFDLHCERMNTIIFLVPLPRKRTEEKERIGQWIHLYACAHDDSENPLVTTIEKSISNGNKVVEVQITTLVELLMRQAVKLDCIPTEGEASSQKNLQAKRVQKCVETLDVLKISNARLNTVVITNKWEIFDPPTMTQWEFFD